MTDKRRAGSGGCSMVRLDQEDMMQTVVFERGEEGCHTYRIPSVVEAADGTLIALAEGRRDNSRDPGGGHIDLVYKLSDDGGKTWSSRRFFDESREGWSASNPTSVLESKTGRIFVLFNRWKPGRGGRNSRPGTLDNQLWMRFSDDHGNSWSKAYDITEQGRDIERWGKAVFGPGHGIETTSGRLVIPVNAPLESREFEETSSFALYSDDGGETWKRGEQIGVYTTENQIVELDDGRLLIDARQKGESETRWMAVSDDQGETWGEPKPGLAVTQICAGINCCPREGNETILFWSGPKGPGRKDLVLRLSTDQGRTFPVEMLIGPGPAAYSDLCVPENCAAGILWEGGDELYEKIIFTRVPLEVMEAQGV